MQQWSFSHCYEKSNIEFTNYGLNQGHRHFLVGFLDYQQNSTMYASLGPSYAQVKSHKFPIGCYINFIERSGKCN